ncbi:hypothetical protein FXN63_14535 [Pigmentiphaga aceris]|uniref:Uncharacterized protein n=1 Tax=Pigmentiphaga aceris TaxID=1940612 RepID=A0A5C0AZ08_9BURK|nr:hypothetical protein [Pigmentiphaga aceris]QEI06916.1 hypothetical protein FXN63_14535 [Pigmentiphaga aceris]
MINANFSSPKPVVATLLRRTVATATVLAATATPLHAASLFVDVEIGDTAIAYVDQATQTRLWPQIWSQAQLIAYYVPTQTIEGQKQRTTPPLNLRNCQDGALCAPDSLNANSPMEREVKATAQVVQNKAGRPVKLRFELPKSPAPHYRFSHARLQASADTLWNQPLFVSWHQDLPPAGQRSFAQQRIKPLVIPLVLAKQPTQDFQLADLNLVTPGQLTHNGRPLAMATVRASLNEPNGSTRQIVPTDAANPAISQKLFVPPEIAKDGDLHFDVRGRQIPRMLSPIHAEEHISKIAMPENAPRWHDLKHRNFPEGTWVKLTQSGPLAQLELEANAGPERAIDGRLPVKRETWIFFQDKPVHYRGQLHYENNVDDLPGVSWQVNWDHERRLNAETKTTSIPACRWQACQDNLAEAKGQMQAPDAKLHAEGLRYLTLARGQE